MINFNAIDTILYNWVVLYSGVSTIWQNSNGPKPDLPFVTLRRQSLESVGHGYVSDPDDSGIAKISGDRDMTVNLQAYGDNAFGVLEDLWNVRLVDASQELLYAGGLALIDQLALTNITGLNDLEYEERATMDLMFRFVSQRTGVDVGLIEEANIEGDLKDPDKEINFTLDLT